MNYEKSFLTELASDSAAHKEARKNPMQVNTESMNFLKSLINKDVVNEDVHPQDKKDTVTLDVPLLIRILELAREEIKGDVELHKVVERILSITNRGTLTMDDYDDIVKDDSTQKDNDINTMKHLAGIR